ncbi:PREDICTED: rhodopsin-like [Branchiostoma belcheri]|uniref:Rhodopsin-like n=1 Tax=Branchiostoma belcheri TaxID=7741 RepID=A0A6P4ZZG6_BRABE|nr:PREDICTED: rhodopsin-like [Branchiostoma belcheri]
MSGNYGQDFNYTRQEDYKVDWALLSTFSVFTGLLNAFSIGLNIVLVTTFVRCKVLHRANNVFIGHLAVSDCLVALSRGPADVVVYALGGRYDRMVVCEWFSFFSTLFTSVSICTMGMIAYQRYNSIVRPKDNCLNSIKRAFIAIPGIWVFGLLCAIPPLAAWNMAIFSVDEYSLPVCSVTTVPRGFAYAVYVAIVALFVPFVAMLVFYFLIYWAVLMHGKKLDKNIKMGKKKKNKYARVEGKTCVLMCMVVITFSLTWLTSGVLTFSASLVETHRTEFLLSTCLLSALATVCDPLVYVFQNQLFRLCVKNIVLFKGPVNDKAYLRIETAANKTVAGPFTTTTNTSNRRRRYPPGEHPITKGLPPAFTVEEPTELKDETDGKAAGLARADSWGRKGSLPPVDPVKEPELFAEIQRRRWSTRRLSVVILGERIDEDDPTSFDSSCDSFRNDRNGHRALHRISETSNSGVEVPTAPATDKPTRSRRGPRKPHRFSVGVPYFHRHAGGRLNNAEQRPPGYISDFARRCSVGRRPSYEVSIELNVTPFDLKTKEKQMTPNEDSN